MPEKQLLYWDANIFISYFNEHPDRLSVIETILENIQNNKHEKIVTSVLSKVEVSWVAHEKLQRLLSDEEIHRIDGLWSDPSIVEIAEFNDEIALLARSLMRSGMSKGWKIKTNDAIHLATAEWVGVYEIHTYDKGDLHRFKEIINIEICEPYIKQPKLF